MLAQNANLAQDAFATKMGQLGLMPQQIRDGNLAKPRHGSIASHGLAHHKLGSVSGAEEHALWSMHALHLKGGHMELYFENDLELSYGQELGLQDS